MLLMNYLMAFFALILSASAQNYQCVDNCTQEYYSCQNVNPAELCMNQRMYCSQTCRNCYDPTCQASCKNEFNSCQAVADKRVCWEYRQGCNAICNTNCEAESS